ncbi:MAG: hypothetical protein HZB29_05905 [Nitrospinae bacterium]|nr:hypothetical protein [Nitrospinota bacterium]
MIHFKSLIVRASVFLAALTVLSSPAAMCAAVETFTLKNDTVKIKKTYRNGDKVKFCISKTSAVKNWKGVKLFHKDGKPIVTLTIEGEDNGPFCATLDRATLKSGFRYELWRRERTLLESYLSGTDVAYPGHLPLGRMEYHWVKEM